MGGVGHEPPPGLLRGLEAVGELVELIGQLGHLVPAPGVHPVAVLPLPHPADGGQQPPGVPGQRLGEQQHQQHGRHADHQGDIPQVGLDGQQHLGLLRVVLIEVHRPQGGPVVQHGHRRPAPDGPLPVLAAGHVPPPQGGHHLPHEGVVPQPVVQGGAVVQNPPRPVRHQHPGALGLFQHRHGLLHPLLGEGFGHRQGGADHQGLLLQGALLGGEHHILHHQKGVGVHHNEDGRHHQQVGQGVFGLDAPGKGHLRLPGRLGCCGHGTHLLSSAQAALTRFPLRGKLVRSAAPRLPTKPKAGFAGASLFMDCSPGNSPRPTW